MFGFIVLALLIFSFFMALVFYASTYETALALLVFLLVAMGWGAYSVVHGLKRLLVDRDSW